MNESDEAMTHGRLLSGNAVNSSSSGAGELPHHSLMNAALSFASTVSFGLLLKLNLCWGPHCLSISERNIFSILLLTENHLEVQTGQRHPGSRSQLHSYRRLKFKCQANQRSPYFVYKPTSFL